MTCNGNKVVLNLIGRSIFYFVDCNHIISNYTSKFVFVQTLRDLKTLLHEFYTTINNVKQNLILKKITDSFTIHNVRFWWGLDGKSAQIHNWYILTSDTLGKDDKRSRILKFMFFFLSRRTWLFFRIKIYYFLHSWIAQCKT